MVGKHVYSNNDQLLDSLNIDFGSIKIGTKKKTGKKNAFSFLYNAGEINNENCKTKKGNEVNIDAKRAILR